MRGDIQKLLVKLKVALLPVLSRKKPAAPNVAPSKKWNKQKREDFDENSPF